LWKWIGAIVGTRLEDSDLWPTIRVPFRTSTIVALAERHHIPIADLEDALRRRGMIPEPRGDVADDSPREAQLAFHNDLGRLPDDAVATEAGMSFRGREGIPAPPWDSERSEV
jgi:hypothetical protein